MAAGANLAKIKGVKENIFDKKMETIKTTVGIVYNGGDEYSPLNELKYDIFSQVLDMVYTEEIREKEGGTYGVSVQGSLQRLPKGDNYSLLIYFDTDKEKTEKLVPIVYRELEKIAKEGPNQDQFNKVIEFLIKTDTESKRDNKAWLDAISEYYMYNTDSFTTNEKNIKSVKPSDIQNVVAKILKDNNRLEVIMNGVSE
jgi:zinc protease